MNFLTLIGIILVVLGVAALVYGGITYTHSKSVVDVGSVHLKVDDSDRISIPPIAGALSVVAGVILILIARKRLVRA